MISLRRGMTFIELLGATVIFVVAAAAAFQAWNVCFGLSRDGRERGVAAEIARADIEKAKVQGFWNLPVGSYVSGTNPYEGSWKADDQYFTRDGQAQAITSPNASTYFRVSRSGRDYRVYRNTDGVTYRIAFNSYRDVVCRVYRHKDGELIYTIGTRLTRGGL